MVSAGERETRFWQLLEEMSRDKRKGLLADLGRFWKFSTRVRFGIGDMGDFLRYAGKLYVEPLLNRLRVPESDELEIRSIEATRLVKYPVDSTIFDDGIDWMTVNGSTFEDYLGRIEGRVTAYSGLFGRDITQLWSAALTRKRILRTIIRGMEIGFMDNPTDFPYMARDFGLACKYGDWTMKRYGYKDGVWRLAGSFYRQLDKVVKEWIIGQNLLDGLFERDMDGASMDIGLHMSTESHEREMAELEASLRKGRPVPSRFLYMGDGARKFLGVAEDPAYSISNRESRILEANSSGILERFNGLPISVVDFGPGNGRKAAILRQGNPGRRMSYHPLDISPVMVYRAASMNRGEGILEGEVSRFDDGYPMPDVAKPALYLLLGNTIGNFEPEGQAGLLAKMSGSMGKKDVLLLGLEMSGSPEEAVGLYSNDNARRLAFNPLEMLGFSEDAFDYEVGFNPEAERVEMRFIPKHHVEAGVNGSKVSLEPGQAVIAALSARMDRAEFMGMLAGADLGVTEEYQNEGYSVLALQKGLYEI